MNFGVLLLAVFKSIMQVVILASAGILLRIFGIFSKTNIKTLSDLNFYLLLPMFVTFELGNAIDLENLYIVGFVFFSTGLVLIISIGLAYLTTLFSGIDIRVKHIYIAMASLANTFSMPTVVVDASCRAQGILETYTALCKSSSNGQNYSTLALMITILFWVIAFGFLNIDKNFSNKYKSEVTNVLKFFPTIDDFLLSPLEKIVKCEDEPNEIIVTKELKRKCNKAFYKKFSSKYAILLSKIKTEPEVTVCLATYKEIKVSRTFLFKTILYPPSFTIFMGILFAMDTRFKQYFFKDSTFAMFLSTIQKIYNMVVPMSWIILGSKLVDSYVYIKSNYATAKDIVLLNIQRFIVMPFLGVAFMYLVKALYPSITDNPVLSLSLYMQWLIPSSSIIMAAFVKENYGAEDATQLLFYSYLICTFPMTIFVALWSVLFNS